MADGPALIPGDPPFMRLVAEYHGPGISYRFGRLGDVLFQTSQDGIAFRPVYFHGRQRDDSKICSSAHFIEFN